MDFPTQELDGTYSLGNINVVPTSHSLRKKL